MSEKKSITIKTRQAYAMFLELNKMVLETLKDVTYDNSFKDSIIDVLEILRPTAQSVEDSSESNIPEYLEYCHKLSVIIKDHADLDSEGIPLVSEDGILHIIEDKRLEYMKTVEELIKEYHSVLVARQTEVNIINEYFDKDLEIELPVIHFNIIPNEVTIDQLRYIKLIMVKE